MTEIKEGNLSTATSGFLYVEPQTYPLNENVKKDTIIKVKFDGLEIEFTSVDEVHEFWKKVKEEREKLSTPYTIPYTITTYPNGGWSEVTFGGDSSGKADNFSTKNVCKSFSAVWKDCDNNQHKGKRSSQ